MPSLATLIKKRDVLVSQLSGFPGAISGNLSITPVPPGSANAYWRITWKVQKKTKIQYVRPDEVEAFKAGIKQFTRLKVLVHRLGDVNRAIILAKRSHA